MSSYGVQLRDVRAHFGLSQQELACWLGLSRAMLANVETDRDALPGHAVPWLWPWLTALSHSLAANPDPVSGPVPVFADPPPGPAALVARLRECRYQAERLRLQLAPLQARNSYLRRRLSVGPVLQAALPPDAAEPAHSPAALRRRWLARLLEAATDGLAPSAPATGSTAEALLTARQAAWLSEAAWLTAYLTGAPAMPLA